ncbi:ABC-type transport auxiliary lipoprotein family protein [Hoeflea sp. TYP-13]|uniref:ABC-type transport auxiliary lipoprotein family protein n=1 Tax=Hoeflea sp. TYP-13 TaxID=3230023 RepID=UPI0034C5CD26
MTFKTGNTTAIVAFMAGVMVIGGCSVLGGGPKNDTYELTGIPPVKGPYSRGRQIVVTDPAALKSLDGTNIVIRTSPSSIQYLAKSQWNDNLPEIIQEKLIEAFEDSDRLGGVGQPGDGIAVDYLISPTIRAFEIITGGGDTAVVEISVRIINDRNGVVRAQRVFQATAPVIGSDNEAFISALDRANGKVMNDIVAWVLKIV